VIDNAVRRQPDQGKILVGLAGRDILASRSPWLHEQEAAAQGLNLDYTLFDFAARGWDENHLSRLLADIAAQGFAGLNITYPFKQAVIPLLDELSSDARQIGAVNTVAFVNGRRIGHNTDVSGFAESFRSGLKGAARQYVVQAGAGGAGSATAHALLAEAVEHVTIFDVDVLKATRLVEQLQTDFGQDRAKLGVDMAASMADADGFLNATPIGMAKHPGTPVDLNLVQSRHWVADIVYFPLETQLLRMARQKGCRVLDGGGMVTSQAATAFGIFTGLTGNRDRMRENFERFAEGG
jgi:shikimate dehydrogenase